MTELAGRIFEHMNRPKVRAALAATACLGFSISTLFTHSGKSSTESTKVFGVCPEGTIVDDADVHHDGSIGPILGWPVVRFECDDGTPASIYFQELMDDEGEQSSLALPEGHFEANIYFTPNAPDGRWDIGLGVNYADYDSTSVVGDAVAIDRISVVANGQEHEVWEN